MKILIVGCGAVGKVYGLALQKVGVKLGLYDQPAITEKLKQALERGGLPLLQVSSKYHKNLVLHWLKDFQVLENITESRLFSPDQIWFTTPSPVYYTEWFRDYLRQVPAGRVVCFVPEGKRSEIMVEGMDDRIIFGGTTFMAWQDDLYVGDGIMEGVIFWRPPLSIPLTGNRGACREAAQLLISLHKDARTDHCFTEYVY